MRTKQRYILVFFGLLLVTVSCSQFNNNDKANEYGEISLSFSHDVLMDTFLYINEAENLYMVNEIQYFVSDVKLYSPNGEILTLDNFEDIHYIDTDLPSTFIYKLQDSIPVGKYSQISFTFGINEEKNKSMLFVNPPESFMFWPEYLGGGYHYMKLNGKWKNLSGETKVFNFHLGIGQVYNDDRSVNNFVQNYQEVFLDNSSIEIRNKELLNLSVEMNINNWFSGPNVFDFNVIGGKIMQNQHAIEIACENLNNVFSINNAEHFDLQ